ALVCIYLYRHLFCLLFFFFFSSRRRHTRSKRDWSSDVCSSDLVYCVPRSLWMIAPSNAGYEVRAFSSVWIHRSAFMFVPIDRPRTLRSKQSNIADTYSFPLRAGISVISVIHFSNGASEWKSRFNRSSDFMASRSAFVSPFGFLFGRWLRPI